MARFALLDDIAVTLDTPRRNPATAHDFSSIPAGKFLPDWQLTLALPNGSVTDAAANRRHSHLPVDRHSRHYDYKHLGRIDGDSLRNQMRHARLKNDLVATVSHELKTPLSSIRLLVDTLLDDQSLDLNKTREYLQLISKENMRLSRLIDNFLTFSRMERNKHAFQFSESIACVNN